MLNTRDVVCFAKKHLTQLSLRCSPPAIHSHNVPNVPMIKPSPTLGGVMHLPCVPYRSVRNFVPRLSSVTLAGAFQRIFASALMASIGGGKASFIKPRASPLSRNTSSGKTMNSPPRVLPLETAVYPWPWAKNPLLGIHTATSSNPTPCTLRMVIQAATMNGHCLTMYAPLTATPLQNGTLTALSSKGCSLTLLPFPLPVVSSTSTHAGLCGRGRSRVPPPVRRRRYPAKPLTRPQVALTTPRCWSTSLVMTI